VTPEEAAEVARSADGRRGWVSVRVVADGGFLRVGSGDGEPVDEAAVRDGTLVWEDAWLAAHRVPPERDGSGATQ
jgi:hypothetical protein